MHMMNNEWCGTNLDNRVKRERSSIQPSRNEADRKRKSEYTFNEDSESIIKSPQQKKAMARWFL